MRQVAVLGGPASWRGQDLEGDDRWIVQLDDAVVDELTAAGQRLIAEGRPLRVGDQLDHTSPETAALAAQVREELVDGRGFVLLRGLPVEHRSIEELEAVYWVLGMHLGIPTAQDRSGTPLVHVRDLGLDYSDPTVRGYQTRDSLKYHVDGADAVGLLCVRAAKSGGVSTIVSSTAVHDEVVARAPRLAALLYEPWWFDRRISDSADSFYQMPVCSLDDDGFAMSYGRYYMESAQRGPQVGPLPSERFAAMDLIDEVCNSPDLVLRMDLEPGDVQFLNNKLIMHSRTAYEDWPEPERKRDMIRLWLSLDRRVNSAMIGTSVGFVSTGDET